MFFYFLNVQLHHYSTIIFSIATAVIISLVSALLISISNNIILPKVQKRFWYSISFLFSFFSGTLGFTISFLIFVRSHYPIIELLEPFWFYISVTMGCLTFLIGLILHQFISMKYKNELIKNQILQTQIKALENELNPHFLFNALNSMSELVYIDPKKAEKSILNLSKFLRNALNQKESLVSVEEELQMVQTYLDIENIRFNNNIKLSIQTNTQDLQAIQIPKFSIQLLIENGIKHGYTSKQLNFFIEIDKFSIKITNNGKISDTIKFGTGLSNLNARLKLLHIGVLKYHTKPQMQFIIELQGEKNENTNSR